MAVMFTIFSAILGRDLLVAADASLAACRTYCCAKLDLLDADEKIRRRASADILKLDNSLISTDETSKAATGFEFSPMQIKS